MKQLQILVMLLLAITLYACQNENPNKNPISTDDPIVDIRPKTQFVKRLNKTMISLELLFWAIMNMDMMN